MRAEAGEPGRNRTFNLQIKSLLLCQLSYGPTRGLARGSAGSDCVVGLRRIQPKNCIRFRRPSTPSLGSPQRTGHCGRAFLLEEACLAPTFFMLGELRMQTPKRPR